MPELPVILSFDFILMSIQNLMIIMVLVLLYNFIPDNKFSPSKRPSSLWVGIIFGFVGLITIPSLWPATNAPSTGLNIILVPLAAFIGGPVSSGIVAAVLLVGSVWSIGAVDMLIVITILSGLLLGSLFYFGKSWDRFPRSSIAQLFLLGIGVSLIEIFSFFLSTPPTPTGSPQFIVIIPFVVTSCLGTILLGSIIGYIDRKKDIERSLALTNRQLNLALEGAKAKKWELDLVTGELHFSRPITPFCSYDPDERPKTFDAIKMLAHPDDVEPTLKNLELYLEGKSEVFESVTRLRAKEGYWIWYLIRGKSLKRDPSGRPIRLIGVVIDITESKQSEEKLMEAYQTNTLAEEELREQYNELARNEQRIRESEEKYRAVVTWANDGILIIQDGVFRFINPKAAELYGRTEEEFIDVPFVKFIHPREQEKMENFYRMWMNNEQFLSMYETTIVKKNGDPVEVEFNIGVITLGGKKAILIFIRDVTDRKRSQIALEQAKKKLNLLNYVTFNDIQNLIFSLSGYQQIIKSTVKEAGTQVETLMRKEEDLLQKIADSLKFARTYQDLGLKPARWQNVNQVFLFAISHIDFREIKHTVTTGSLEIFADPLLEQVFQIFADNTCTHSKTGTHVTIGYVQESDETLTLFFEDNGIGVPDDIKSEIFLPEFQKKKSVGLFLAREILEITEISIKETGTHGKGVRFEMTVPKRAYRFLH
jgi:PAS domain S-box-containing protein